jgi:hypothetical protein
MSPASRHARARKTLQPLQERHRPRKYHVQGWIIARKIIAKSADARGEAQIASGHSVPRREIAMV